MENERCYSLAEVQSLILKIQDCLVNELRDGVAGRHKLVMDIHMPPGHLHKADDALPRFVVELRQQAITNENHIHLPEKKAQSKSIDYRLDERGFITGADVKVSE